MAAALVTGTAGCDSLLDVTNPNNVVQEDLENASAVNAMVNGALARTASALGNVAVSTAALSDETTHTGSQNWAAELDVGSITNKEGRSNALFNDLAEARWLSDEALKIAQNFSDELTNKSDLARANLYSGINYMTIADNFEDFTFSDRTEVSPPVGEANMAGVYDTAIERFRTAETEATRVGNASLAITAKALRARAQWAQSLWGKLNPPGQAPADPWIDDPEANALAAEVLAAVEPDWKFAFAYSSSTQTNPLGSWINSRQEFVIGPAYAKADGTGKRVDFITLQDPVDGVADPALESFVDEFVTAFLYPDLTVVSARELHLILAEAAHVQGNTAEAVQHINAVRTLKGTSAFDPAAHAATVADMIQHERRVNLFMQPTRRIWDMYRFDIEDEAWAPGSDVTHNGQMFIIGQDEQISNCFILGTC